MILQHRIERAVSVRRPDLAHLGGDHLLASLMARIAADACQVEPVDPVVTGPACDGYAHDSQSVKALRFLLRNLYPCLGD